MSTTTAYCPVCDRHVPLTETLAPLHEGEANLPDAPQLVCRAFGDRCTGAACPVSGYPSVVMGVRLARSDLRPDRDWLIIERDCNGCGRFTEMRAVDRTYAVCSECGTTNRWGEEPARPT
jgi:hypothetical protein